MRSTTVLEPKSLDEAVRDARNAAGYGGWSDDVVTPVLQVLAVARLGVPSLNG